ncbi:hypothetical protein [Nocardia crassostreae]|uniref:hypothetical protein n=1 Tax=Nocardia crassostreae TaxID=53428 RepID=UPI00082EC3E1|nr:hypothetical protein [Nocardia crassostreae]
MSKRIVFAVLAIAALTAGGCDLSGGNRAAPVTHTSRAATTTTTPTTTRTTTPTTTTTTPPLLTRRGENGQIYEQSGLVGTGNLRIINDEDRDVAIVVTNDDPKNPQATMYVHANSEATMSGISGNYYVYLKYGTDWDEATLSFTRSRQFEKFDEPLDEWTNWTLSLEPSPEGNATVSTVPAF